MRIAAADFLTGIEFLDVIGKKSLSSEFFRVKSGRGEVSLALAGDFLGEVRIAAETDSTVWTAFIARKPLRTFLGKGFGDLALRILKTDTEVRIKGGRREAKFTFPAISPTGYGTLPPDLQEVKIPISSELCSALCIASKYCTEDAEIPGLSLVHIFKSGKVVMATNRLSAFQASFGDTLDADVGIPPKFVPLLSAGDCLNISAYGVRFLSANGWLLHLSSEDALKFPLAKLSAMFDAAKQWKTKVRLSREEFLGAIDRLAKLGADIAVANVTGLKGETVVRLSSVSDSATFIEKVPALRPLSGDLAESFLLPSIRPFVAESKAEDIAIAWEPGGPYRFTDGSTRILISPRSA